MQAKKACEAAGITQKALRYYEAQKLLSPTLLENGYRDYREEDIIKLRKIASLRRLGLSTQEIRTYLQGCNQTFLKRLVVQKKLAYQLEGYRFELLEGLAISGSFDKIEEKLKQFAEQQTIAERLLDAFPGYLGQYVCLHFARFLGEPIMTQQQQQAFEEIKKFLDQMPELTLSKECRQIVSEYSETISCEQMQKISENLESSLENPVPYWEENRKVLEEYLAFRQSETYRQSNVARLMEAMKSFCSSSGYYDIFLPAMRRLSPAYAAYYEKLEKANAEFLKIFPTYNLQEKGPG